MEIGFTGTQAGMSKKQKLALIRLLNKIDEFFTISEFHHGDCIGSDKESFDIIRSRYGSKCNIVAHPPKNPKKRAWTDSDEIREVKDYLIRNHDIVDETKILIGCPHQLDEKLRSGTWSTIRYGWKTGKFVIIVFPNGFLNRDVQFSNWKE